MAYANPLNLYLSSIELILKKKKKPQPLNRGWF